MAFKTLSGLIGGGLLSGNVFVSSTDAVAADIISDGFIPDKVAVALKKGDLIVMNYFGTADDPSTITTDWAVNQFGTLPSKLETIDVYGGAFSEIPAGFSRKYLTGNIGAGAGNGEAFSLYSYNNGVDNMDEIAAEGYFNDAADILNVKDVITVTSATGAANGRGADLLKVTAISAAGVVTTVATDFKRV